MKLNPQSQLIAKLVAVLTITNIFTLVLPQVAFSNTIVLKGTIRDFSDQHPDFERQNGQDGFHYGLDQNITTDTIGTDNKPVYAGGSFSTTTKANFDQWYRDVPNVNQKKNLSIQLKDDDRDGVYRYQNTSFFPINNKLMGNEGRDKNFHFTYEIHSKFTYQGGESFHFSGDDDVWVYINGHKVIDIGGVHGKTDAHVNLDEIAAAIGIEVGGTYNLDFFFAERHVTQSNFIIETTMLLENPKPD